MLRWMWEELQPGDDVVVHNPVDRKRPLRGKLVSLRRRDRTAVVQDPYEWRARRVPAAYVNRKW